MGVVEDLADKLARDTIEAAEKYDDPNLIDEMSQTIGAASQTTQEAFMTAVRVRLSAKKGHQFLARKIEGYEAKGRGQGGRTDLAGRKIMNSPDDGAQGGGH